jgi:MoxR-like ATPase
MPQLWVIAAFGSAPKLPPGGSRVLRQNKLMEPQLLRDALADLDRNLLERDVAVRVLLLAALAGEHVLLIGPPGTAKSELARRLHRVFAGARYFERLLTRFSVPEELFGPLSLKALEFDRYERLTDGFLPTAQVAFLDEVFKANSAILNALLTLLNEREFDNGSGRVKVPLISVVGATNEVPEDESLHAFYDRFLLRVPVGPVNDASFTALLALPAEASPGQGRIAAPNLAQLQQQSEAVALPAEVTSLLVEARAWCSANAVTVSDRRWRKVAALLKVQAASRAQAEVSPWDLWILPFALVAKPEQGAPMVQWFLHAVAMLRPLDAQWLTRAADAFEKQLEIELRAEAADDEGAGKLALARAIAGQRADNENGMLRIVSERAARRYSRVHVDARVAQVTEALERAQMSLEQVRSVAQAALAQARSHLWLPPSWLERIAAGHHANVAQLATLVERLLEAQQGFAALPIQISAAAEAPKPIALAA